MHRLERLSEHLGGRVEIWAKRDDCNSGLAYGGNKTRKLEYLAADALAQGCDTLVSIGGVQSNHTRQVAAVAAHLGLKCVLVQEHWVDWDDPGYERVGNILLSRIMGADVRLSDAGFDIAFRPSWEEALASVEAAGGKPYAIPAGASDHPLGGLGFARWADEVAAQERELGVFFDTIVVCSVTGSTQAGMIAGFAAQERPRACSASTARRRCSRRGTRSRASRGSTAEAIELGRALADDEIVLLDEWHAGTYGIPDEKTLAAIRLCARLEGVLTDPVYEGKSMAALIDLVRDGRIEPGSTVLYAHLGGRALPANAVRATRVPHVTRTHRPRARTSLPPQDDTAATPAARRRRRDQALRPTRRLPEAAVVDATRMQDERLRDEHRQRSTAGMRRERSRAFVT